MPQRYAPQLLRDSVTELGQSLCQAKEGTPQNDVADTIREDMELSNVFLGLSSKADFLGYGSKRTAL